MLFPRAEKTWQRLRAFVKDKSGATAIEYAIIASGISIVIVAAVNGIGTKLNTTFGSVSTQLK
jgi:pilus assembly protein Flp/PilA